MQSVCVFCASSVGARPEFAAAATALGRTIAERGLRLVYGGGHVGLMGVVADAALAAGGEVLGVIPQALMDRELGHGGITELRVTRSMHERKQLMCDESDGFIALPGGFGTLDELCEILTWAQLGIHANPIALLDVDGFFSQLTGFFDGAVKAGFIRPEHRAMLLAGTDPHDILDRMTDWQPTTVVKWTDAVVPRP